MSVIPEHVQEVILRSFVPENDLVGLRDETLDGPRRDFLGKRIEKDRPAIHRDRLMFPPENAVPGRFERDQVVLPPWSLWRQWATEGLNNAARAMALKGQPLEKSPDR